jgi:hypothetical protein
MPIYIITGIFIIIKEVFIYIINTSTKTGIVYSYKVLVIIGASLILQVTYLVAIIKVKPEEIFSITSIINISQIGSTIITFFLANIIFQNMGFIKLRNTLIKRGFSTKELRGTLAGIKSIILISNNSNI